MNKPGHVADEYPKGVLHSPTRDEAVVVVVVLPFRHSGYWNSYRRMPRRGPTEHLHQHHAFPLSAAFIRFLWHSIKPTTWMVS
ncbi:hypothetical protein QE152_g26958 [Popillia japonica]|uniref:Uncharacterized protein n=1 Tax=Popillia japonica TaxID=7064 RepID=A0AAW1JWH5_POPJA